MSALRLFACVVLALLIPCHGSIEEIFQWGFLDYNFPYDTLHRSVYRPENTVLTGLEIGWDRVYLSAPRLRPGVPATLASIPRNIQPGTSPILEAFPDWSWHGAGQGDFNCSGLISVYRMRADRCDRLWVLDSGVMDSIDNFTRVCPPKIVIFDMRTSRPLRVIRMPDELVREFTLTTNLVIDDTESTPQGKCDDVVAYMTDTAAPALLVYDGRSNSAWRVTHAAMYPDPDMSEYRIGEDTFTLNDGVVGMAFSPNQKLLYFQPLATDRTFCVPTAALKRGPVPEEEELPVKLVGRKSSPGLPLAVDPLSDTLFYSPMTETAIASWNPLTNHHEILAYDPARLQFAAEIRWVDRDGGSVWVLSSRFQKYFLRTATANEINQRIIRILPDFQPEQRLRFYRHANQTSALRNY